MEIEELIEKIDGFLDKQGVDLEGKEKITRLMAERYWEDIKGEGEEEESNFEEFDETIAGDEKLDIPPPPPPKKRKGRPPNEDKKKPQGGNF